MKKVYMLTIGALVLLGMMTNSFAASQEETIKSAAEEASDAAAAEVIPAENSAIGADDTETLILQLVEAVAATNIAEVRRLIALGAPVNVKVPEDMTTLNELPEEPILYTAIGLTKREDRAEIVKALIAAGADANERGLFGEDALSEAIRYRSSDAVNYLLHGGADIESGCEERGSFGGNMLERACRNWENYDTVRLLIIAGDDINARDSRGKSLLLHVMVEAREWDLKGLSKEVYKKIFDTVRMLILAGAYEGCDAKNKESIARCARQLGEERMIDKAVLAREAYVSRCYAVSEALQDCTSLSGDVQNLVKDYEDDNDEFAFLKERTQYLAKRARAGRVLREFIRDRLAQVDVLTDLVLEYAPARLVNLVSHIEETDGAE